MNPSKRVAIITGASSGLGREFARQLDAQQVADELWLVARNEKALTDVAGELDTPFGETLSWPYLQYVRAHPVSRWPTPTALLYASGDAMLRRTGVEDFARRFGGALTVLEGGEHWFHTPEQLAALHRWESDVLEQMK